MTGKIIDAAAASAARVAAWADLIDAINVFPVADADTGRNLVTTLAPLRGATDPDATIDGLRRQARGNAGNIAAAFLSELLAAPSATALPDAARTGRKAAWAAVADPVPGTMLSVFDALADGLTDSEIADPSLVDRLALAVRETPRHLPVLRSAGVVDAGALGAFIFLEGFLGRLAERADGLVPPTRRFAGQLRRTDRPSQDGLAGHCVQVAVEVSPADRDRAAEAFRSAGESAVITPAPDGLTVHLHTDDADTLRRRADRIGRVTQWHDEPIAEAEISFPSGPVRILTDAAGSVSREDARRLGITLLDAYVTVGDRTLPETSCPPELLYAAMRDGQRVTTAQASRLERHEHYAGALARFDRVVYLCVGSAFTGHHREAVAWQPDGDPDGRMTVIDTGAASGRLGLAALATAAVARTADDPDAVIRFARWAAEASDEWVFIDRLRYLAAGGRISGTAAWIGDRLKMKPVISPRPEGVKKLGAVRDSTAQQRFLRRRLASALADGHPAWVLLQYTDAASVGSVEAAASEIRSAYPEVRRLIRPLSRTSGAHMGPGTWAVAVLTGPDLPDLPADIPERIDLRPFPASPGNSGRADTRVRPYGGA